MNAWAVTVGLVASSALGQVTLEVKDFSDVVRAQVHLEQPGEVFSPGWVALIDKQTGKVLVRVKSDELAVTTGADGTANSNVRELPYGEQSVIIAGDFNFDGTPDVAVMDGQHSCYHGPSYQVFLAGPKGLRKSAAFTELAQSYCGFFDVDVPHQRLHTMTKSGCCWHEFSTFKVVNGAPVVEQVVTEDAKDAPLVLVTTTSG